MNYCVYTDKRALKIQIGIICFCINIENMKKSILSALILSLLTVGNLLAQSGSNEKDQLLGVWLTGSKKAKVEIYKCDELYCGKIIWLRDPLNDEGKPKLDKNNPDDKLKKRALLGMNILTDFEYDEDLEWEDGEIYDPENGKTYSCEIWMDDKDMSKLNVRGYVGISLIGRTDIWSRVEP